MLRPTALVAALTLAAPLSIPPALADQPDHRPVRGWSVALGEQSVAAHGQRLADTRTFEMLGVTWRSRNAPDVEVRTHTEGAWTQWRDLEALGEHAPDRNTREATRSTHSSARASELIWVGPSDGVQVRVDGGRKGLRVVLVDPGSSPVDTQAVEAPAKTQTSARTAASGSPEPWMRKRGHWDANENWRNGGPSYVGKIKQAHVHHTAGSNNYSKADVAGIIRGMYWYHTQQLGWSDLGYNFLVDRFGRLWEGRAGGIRRAVKGAHTLGFNHKSFGVAVIGTYTNVRPSFYVVQSLVYLISWKLDKYHRNAQGNVGMYSQGSDRYPQGRFVRLPIIDGHRDTNYTACPGDRLYQKLRIIRNRAQSRIDRY